MENESGQTVTGNSSLWCNIDKDCSGSSVCIFHFEVIVLTILINHLLMSLTIFAGRMFGVCVLTVWIAEFLQCATHRGFDSEVSPLGAHGGGSTSTEIVVVGFFCLCKS